MASIEEIIYLEKKQGESINLNTNPLQILVSDVERISWNQFQLFLKAKGVVKDPTNNSGENKKIADALVSEFNSGKSIVNGVKYDWVIKHPGSEITKEQIVKAQKYHKITDPRVIIDEGWVGSQTSQFKYPTIHIYYVGEGGINTLPITKTGYIGIIWGNKRFIVTPQQVEKNIRTTGLAIPPSSEFVLYNDSIHKDTLQRNALPKNIWDNFNELIKIYPDPVESNKEIALNNKKRAIIQSQINITKSILNK